MFKKLLLIVVLSFGILVANAVAMAKAPALNLKYKNSGVITFQEPDDILAYRVFYSNTSYEFGLVLESDLSMCPANLGLYCVAESISRSGNQVFLNLKDNFKDTSIAIKYVNLDLQESPISNVISLENEIRNIKLSAHSDDNYVYLDVENPRNIDLSNFNFRGYFKNGKHVSPVDNDDFEGCRNYVNQLQIECLSESFEKLSNSRYRIAIKNLYAKNNSFIFGYEDEFSSYVSYSNPVYLTVESTASSLERIENVRVNDARQLFFDQVDLAKKYFVSYNLDYPGYSPSLDELDFCNLQDIDSGCVVSKKIITGRKIYLQIDPDIESAFFSVYYLGANNQISPVSRPVYVANKTVIPNPDLLEAPVLSHNTLGEVSFEILDSAERYFLVHTYGDRSGYLYKSDFPGCRFASLSCAGFNIRKVSNRYFIKIRPEKTGNRFAIYYQTKDGIESKLSNSIFIQDDNSVTSGNFTDINFTEYFEAISQLRKMGIVNGYADGTFRPFQNISRAEFLKILIEARFPEIDSYRPGYSCFSDTHVSDWFNKYTCFAKEKGIVSGYADGSFAPGKAISLAEGLKIALDSFGFVSTLQIYDPNFWYVPYMDAALIEGLLPISSRKSTADYLINRGEMAYITYKILNN